MSRIPKGARAGTSLYMVILLTGILFTISVMLPQLLVQAASGIKLDRGRDHLMDALDSGVAFAEARVKRDVTNKVQNFGQNAPQEGYLKDAPGPGIKGMGGWVAKPTYDNPDFGPKRDLNFEVRCLKIRLFNVVRGLNSETYEFNYTLQAGAWDPRAGTSKRAEVNGVASVAATVDRTGARTVNSVKLQAINREVPGAYVPLTSASATPF